MPDAKKNEYCVAYFVLSKNNKKNLFVYIFRLRVIIYRVKYLINLKIEKLVSNVNFLFPKKENKVPEIKPIAFEIKILSTKLLIPI